MFQETTLNENGINLKMVNNFSMRKPYINIAEG